MKDEAKALRETMRALVGRSRKRSDRRSFNPAEKLKHHDRSDESLRASMDAK